MIISHSKKFIMFRPWKTASQTMSQRLKTFSESTYPYFFYFNPFLNRIVHQHITCADFACLPESKLGYFSASFVRNPYDRVYSGFLQLQKDIDFQPSAKFPADWIKRLVLTQLDEIFEEFKKANFDFDRWFQRVGEEQIYEIGRNSSFPLHPAHYWTHLNGEKCVDFVGRVENFENDFKVFLSKTNIDSIESINANVSGSSNFPEESPNEYRYTNRMKPKTIEKINRIFEKDFELFDYKMIGK
ncbi:MAG: sulfotransferase family protein [Melioribacteraceae bacterium]|nr:sulfotransferase family protein [Melioribacteraceae bacterium]MCF8263415.1 sulfotransferase family protein [Melioribacteraceae bacterium]MCF8430413.1 sulfotransferase family protein [Melioribacteraceae bacterium]